MSRHIRRRDFLILGSSGAAFSLLGGGALAARVKDDAEPAPLAVGYWTDPMEDAPVAASGPFRADVMDAAHLPGGDREFLSRGARITLHGVVESGRRWPHAELDALSVAVSFDVQGEAGRETIRHHAWDLRKAPVRNASAGASFTVPVTEASGLRLSVGRYDAMPSPPGRFLRSRLAGAAAAPSWRRASWQEVELSVHPGPGRPALRRGVYFLAGLTLQGGAPRSWHGLQFHARLADDGVRDRRLVRRGLPEPVPAEFDYLVVSVDHAA